MTEIRKLSQGDNWYFEGKPTEATPAEIEAWKDNFCHYCGGGSLFDKRLKSLEEQCKLQIPCPVCEGTGRGRKKNEPRHSYIKNTKIIFVGTTKIDPDSFCPTKKIVVEFDYQYEAQQDGRPLSGLYAFFLKAYRIGFAIQSAILEWNKEVKETI